MANNQQNLFSVNQIPRTKYLLLPRNKSKASVNNIAIIMKIVIVLVSLVILMLVSAFAPLVDGFHLNGSQHRHHHHQQQHHEKHVHGDTNVGADSLPEVHSKGDASNRTGATTLHHRHTDTESSAVYHANWRRLEMMDSNGLYWLEWWLQDKRIYLRVTVNTQGYIGLGFFRKTGRSAGADLVLLWVDDQTDKPNALVIIIYK